MATTATRITPQKNKPLLLGIVVATGRGSSRLSAIVSACSICNCCVVHCGTRSRAVAAPSTHKPEDFVVREQPARRCVIPALFCSVHCLLVGLVLANRRRCWCIQMLFRSSNHRKRGGDYFVLLIVPREICVFALRVMIPGSSC